METLRNELYNQIEALEVKLMAFPTNQYGYSTDPKATEIRIKIQDLENKISETWTN